MRGYLMGTVWLLGAARLCYKGLVLALPFIKSHPVCSLALALLAIGIGGLKGHFVLRKAAARSMQKFSISYCFLIGLMVGLGVALNLLPIAPQVRGFIDLAIAAALLIGSKTYFLHRSDDLLESKS
jgi:hypothetical protein